MFEVLQRKLDVIMQNKTHKKM